MGLTNSDKLAEISQQIRELRLQRKKLEENSEVKISQPKKKKKKAYKFVSGVKPDLYHPNLEYALAEVSYSPYLTGHTPKLPNMSAGVLMNKMRFLGAKECKKKVESGLIKLPCNPSANVKFVKKYIMTYNPAFGPEDNKNNDKDRASTAASRKRPGTSLSSGFGGDLNTNNSSRAPTRGNTAEVNGGSTLLTVNSTSRPRSPTYMAAVARGGPVTYKKKLKQDRFNERKDFESEFYGLFDSCSLSSNELAGGEDSSLVSNKTGNTTNSKKREVNYNPQAYKNDKLKVIKDVNETTAIAS